ncbi:MAG: hypothetical protein IJO32_02385 [Bacilli bacterium]|nr:hypothetical protein [Bacilli bacterium]
MEDYVISPANLEILESNLGAVAGSLQDVVGNISSVSGHVNKVDEKVNNMSTEVKSLADQIKEFMSETKMLSVVTNAKQSILMASQELDKKYGHYDTIRRQTTGILQSTDMSVIKKSTLESMTEETIMKAPNYWLAKALVALSAWINNNRELANNALKEAMAQDDEKTSLLFCLICRRANKLESSIKWIDRYLTMQDPSKMENKIITVMDAFASGLFGIDTKVLLLQKIDAWTNELETRAGINEMPKNRWINFIEEKMNSIEIDDKMYPYLAQFSTSWPQIKEILALSETHNEMYKYFNTIMNSRDDSIISVTNQVDNMLNNLVFNYDSEELELRREIAKNKFIVEENGNVEKAYKRFEENSSIYEKASDFYTQVTNIAINPELSNCLTITRKFAISLSKNWIIDAYNELMEKKNSKELPDINIKIVDWEGVTKDGMNEKELKESLFKHIDNKTHDEVFSEKIINYKVILSVFAIIMGAFLTTKIKMVGLAIIVIAALFGFYEFYKSYGSRNIKVGKVNDIKKNAAMTLSNCLAEVVEYNKKWNTDLTNYNNLINYLKGLNKEQFIMSTNSDKTRQIIINK